MSPRPRVPTANRAAARAAARAAVALVAAVALTGCGAGGGRGVPTWVPKPAVPPVGEPAPQLPGQPLPGPQGPNGQPVPGQPGVPSPGSADDPNVLASNLREPWGLAVLADGNAIVGERPTGRLLRVHADRSPPDVIQTIGDLDTTGDGGLLGIALSPAYSEDRLVFAYLTTSIDNRIVKFELGGKPAPVLTGIPKGRTGNGGRIAFGPDGMLYVGTGDTGRPGLAQDPRSLAGKILRVNEFGKPAPDNPTTGSAVFSSGHGSVSGLCWTDDRTMFDVENAGADGELNQIEPGGNYGWPATRGQGPRRGYTDPELTAPAGTGPVGGCAVIRFGLFVATLTGKRLLAVPLGGNAEPGAPQAVLTGIYGRLRTVEAAPDSALWLTTANRDGRGTPVPADDRVVRIEPPPDSTTSPV
jgi:glucose/arabinose dehydrogenase